MTLNISHNLFLNFLCNPKYIDLNSVDTIVPRSVIVDLLNSKTRLVISGMVMVISFKVNKNAILFRISTQGIRQLQPPIIADFLKGQNEMDLLL